MNILLVKEKKEADQYFEKMSELGKVHYISALSIAFVNQDLLENIISEKSIHDHIIFTSANAVKAIQNVLRHKPEVAKKALVHRPKCYVVGKGTEKLASELGFSCFGSSSGNAENLARFIIEDTHGNAGDCKYLFLCGQMKRETLPGILSAGGYNLTCVTVYKTTEHPHILEAISSFRCNETAAQAIVVFFSPSGVAYCLPKFRSVYGEDLCGLHFAAIGETTAEALGKNAVKSCCVASSPTPEGLASAIKTFCSYESAIQWGT